MSFFFSGFNVIFLKLQNGYISANKLNFEKLSPLSFLKLLKLEKIKCLYFCIFWLIFRDMVILWIIPNYCSKSLFSQILTREGNFVKKWLNPLSLKHNITLGSMNIDFYDWSKMVLLTLNYREVLTMSLRSYSCLDKCPCESWNLL